MKGHALEVLVWERTPRSRPDLDGRARTLRRKNLLPPRGEKIEALHAVAFLIACAGGSAAQAVETFGLFNDLTAGAQTDRFGTKPTFGKALEEALSNPALARTIQVVRLLTPLPTSRYLAVPVADIVFGEENAPQRCTYSTGGLVDLLSNSQHSRYLGRPVWEYGGGLIETIAESLQFSGGRS